MSTGVTTGVPVEFRIQPCAVTPISLDVPVVDSLRLADCAAPHGNGPFGRLYNFTASAGDSVSVTISTSAFSASVALDTAPAAAAPVLAQSATCPLARQSACLLYRLLPRTGTYIVEITSGALRQTGQFTLRVTQPHPPLPSESLAQLLNDSATAIAIGASISQAGVVLRAVASDPDAGDSLHLEVEVRPVGTAFIGTPTAAGDRVANGAQAWVGVAGLADNAAYHWQCRTVDQTGRIGAWVPFRSNSETAADFTVAVRPDHARPVPSGRRNSGSDRRNPQRAVHDPQGNGSGPRPGRPAAAGRRGAAGREPVHEYADRLEHSRGEPCHCSRDGRGPGGQRILPLAGADCGSDESRQCLGVFRWERGDGSGL